MSAHKFWGDGPDGLCSCEGCNPPDRYWEVTFDRLGRTHNPPAITVPVDEYENGLVEAIEDYAARFCKSLDLEAICTRRSTDGQEMPMAGAVYAGVRLAGQFTIELRSVAS